MEMLEKMLDDMVSVVLANEIAVHKALKGGLHIYLRHEDDGFHLALMRKGVYPSMNEWNVVLAAWPWHVIKNPEKKLDEHRINFFLTAVIPDRMGK